MFGYIGDPATDDKIEDTVRSGLSAFVRALTGYRDLGKTFDEAVDEFRLIVSSSTPLDVLLDVSPTEKADLIRVFEASVERVRQDAPRLREFAEWVSAHPQFPYEDAQRRHPETGDGLDETGAIL